MRDNSSKDINGMENANCKDCIKNNTNFHILLVQWNIIDNEWRKDFYVNVFISIVRMHGSFRVYSVTPLTNKYIHRSSVQQGQMHKIHSWLLSEFSAVYL